MDHLTFINSIAQTQGITVPPVRFMVSGEDAALRDAVLTTVLSRCRELRQRLIIVNNTTDSSVGLDRVRALGYGVCDVMEGCRLFDPFDDIDSAAGQSRLRRIMAALGYSELQKAALISYLRLIRDIEGGTLTADVLSRYGSVLDIEERLVQTARTPAQRERIIQRYNELSAAAADFDSMLTWLLPFISGERPPDGCALCLPVGMLGDDTSFKSVILRMLGFELERAENTAVVILDDSQSEHRCIYDFVTALPRSVDTHIFSDDIFTVCADDGAMATLFDRFSARVYGKHVAMASAQRIERAFGDIDVVKSEYTMTVDRRWRANSPWDVLLGNNKAEAYTTPAPVREPRYRKEMVQSFELGCGIVEFMGSSTLFTLQGGAI